MSDVLKFVAVGDSGVGKTCLLLRICDNQFEPSFHSTVGVDFRIRHMIVRGTQSVRLQIWDTAGQERFRAITSAYYRGAQAVLLVYAIDSAASFASCERWLQEYRNSPNSNAVVFLIGTKADTEGERCVTTQAANEWAQQRGLAGYWEVSAKTGANVELCFEAIAAKVMERPSPPPPPQGAGEDSPRQPNEACLC